MNILWALFAMALGSFGGTSATLDSVQGNNIQLPSLSSSFNNAIIQSQRNKSSSTLTIPSQSGPAA